MGWGGVGWGGWVSGVGGLCTVIRGEAGHE